jgi:hypothetical protein
LEVRGPIVERFATAAEHATINGCNGDGPVIARNEVRLNRCVKSRSPVRYRTTGPPSGADGASADSVRAVFQRNEVYQNDIARFDPTLKRAEASSPEPRLLVQDNFVRWFDRGEGSCRRWR